jgi:ureidoacrylate peracid hydrolase
MVDHIKPALEAARRIGLPIIYLNNSNQMVATERSEFGSLLVRTHGLTVEERWETDPAEFRFSSLIEPQPDEYIVRKQMYSGFFDSCLDTLLRNLRIRNLVVVGFATNACVLGTLHDALYRNYRIILLRDGTAAMEYHDTLEDQMITRYTVRHVEAFLGYTAASREFTRSCDQIPARAPSRS